MSCLEEPLTKYLDDLASDRPAPGGGSAAAVAGALGAALGSMVANFTVGKEKFKDVEAEAQSALERCEELRRALTRLIQDDIDAYSAYAKASQLPRGTEAEKAQRREAVQEAMKVAAAAPFTVCTRCMEVLEVLRELLKIGNPNLISDVGCGAELAYAAMRAALLNVEINHSFLKDAQFVDEQKAKLEVILPKAEGLRNTIWEETRKKLSG